jgi:hypothetical protein
MSESKIKLFEGVRQKILAQIFAVQGKTLP